MTGRVSGLLHRVYERLLEAEIDETPSHVAVIQDGNRRYAASQGAEATAGHRAGAQTTENLLRWCDELDIEEVTLYAFSTENFNRSPDEREVLFDLIAGKLREFADADRVHEDEVHIRAIGDTDRLPPRVQSAIEYAHDRTVAYEERHLNVALAYGGRAELLDATKHIARDVATGALDPEEVDVKTVADALYDGPTRDVDLIVRTGGDERTSNFLPWQANGNEAAVYFCTPYWPEFRKIDFLRCIRTYQHRQEHWRQTRARRALALLRAMGETDLPETRAILERVRDPLPRGADPTHQPLVDGEGSDTDGRPSD